MAKRAPPRAIDIVLKYDAEITKKLVTVLLSNIYTKTLAIHGKALEISCNGIAWIATWLAFIWIAGNKDSYEMQLNMLVGLLLDVVIIALLKATFRRRRPTACDDMLTIGPDKFSFPSGHASRAFFVLTFFTCLHKITILLWPALIAWAVSVALSRILLRRHYLLDVVAGILLGIIETGFLALIWIGKDTAFNLINHLTEDNLPGGEAEI